MEKPLAKLDVNVQVQKAELTIIFTGIKTYKHMYCGKEVT
jgi:hypothetical protein